MRTSNQAHGRSNLTDFAAIFSKNVARHMEAVEQEAQAAIRRNAAQRAARERAERRQREQEEALVKPRIELAHKGLERIRALGQSEPIQQILKTLRRLHDKADNITLYSVERPSGDFWERDDLGEALATREVVVYLLDDSVRIFYGAWHENGGQDGEDWQFGHDGSIWHNGEDADLDELWQHIATPHAANLALVRRLTQRSLEWAPDPIAFEFLVSCGRRQAQFDQYVNECLAALRTTLS